MASFADNDVRVIAQVARQVRARNKPLAVFMGAGCSAASGIPLAAELAEKIRLAYGDTIGDMFPAEGSIYATAVAGLTHGERHDMIAPFLADAMVSEAHLALAALIAAGFVGRVLTLNFDMLLERACALNGLMPAVYDLSAGALRDLDQLSTPAIVHLHGQGLGLAAFLTQEDADRQAEEVVPVIAETLDLHPLLVIGYSGREDRIFPKLVSCFRGRERLYWVGHDRAEPQPHVRSLLAKSPATARYVSAESADGFLVALARQLGCWPPVSLSDPADAVRRQIKMSVEAPESPVRAAIITTLREEIPAAPKAEEPVPSAAPVLVDVKEEPAPVPETKVEPPPVAEPATPPPRKTRTHAKAAKKEEPAVVEAPPAVKIVEPVAAVASVREEPAAEPSMPVLSETLDQEIALAMLPEESGDTIAEQDDEPGPIQAPPEPPPPPKPQISLTVVPTGRTNGVHPHSGVPVPRPVVEVKPVTPKPVISIVSSNPPEVEKLPPVIRPPIPVQPRVRPLRARPAPPIKKPQPRKQPLAAKPVQDVAPAPLPPVPVAAPPVERPVELVIEEHVTKAKALVHRAIAQKNEQVFLEAFAAFAEACKLDPQNYNTLIDWADAFYALALRRKDDQAYVESFRRYEAAAKVKPEEPEVFLRWADALANFAFRRNNEPAFRQSFEKYQTVTTLAPDHPRAYGHWGEALLQMGNFNHEESAYSEACSRFASAFRIDPSNLMVLNNWSAALVGWFHLRENPALLEAAEKILARAESISGKPLYNSACVAALKGDFDACRLKLEACKAAGVLPEAEALMNDRDLEIARDTPWFRALVA